jgi:hypothetical protein
MTMTGRDEIVAEAAQDLGPDGYLDLVGQMTAKLSHEKGQYDLEIVKMIDGRLFATKEMTEVTGLVIGVVVVRLCAVMKEIVIAIAAAVLETETEKEAGIKIATEIATTAIVSVDMIVIRAEIEIAVRLGTVTVTESDLAMPKGTEPETRIENESVTGTEIDTIAVVVTTPAPYRGRGLAPSTIVTADSHPHRVPVLVLE